MLWRSINRDGLTEAVALQEGCSMDNTAWSFAVILIIQAVPMIWGFRSLVSLPHQACKAYKIRAQVHVLRCITWWVLVCAYTTVGVAYRWYPRCTYIGSCGHQIWTAVRIPNPIVRLVGIVIYLRLCTVSNFMDAREGMVNVIFMLTSGPLIVVMFFLCGYEFGSFWCFSASVMCIYYYIEPWVDNHAPPFLAKYCCVKFPPASIDTDPGDMFWLGAEESPGYVLPEYADKDGGSAYATVPLASAIEAAP
jgi:hypothetical protein